MEKQYIKVALQPYLVNSNKFLVQIGHIREQINTVKMNSGYNKKKIDITEFDCQFKNAVCPLTSNKGKTMGRSWRAATRGGKPSQKYKSRIIWVGFWVV